jgi:phenylacetate-CoA ligase
MSLSLKIYNRLPVFLQNVACSWHGRHLLKTRYNADFNRLLAELNESQWWELDKLKEYQNQKVRELMTHVYENVPYYNRVMKERNLTPKDFETADDLVKMPILTKEIVRREGNNMVAKNINLHKNAVHCHTSGTTGAGLKFWVSLYAINFFWAAAWRHRMRFGVHFLQSHANFGVNLVVPPYQTTPPFWRENRPLNQTYCSIYHLNDKFLDYYVEMLEQRQFVYFAGYPSALYSIADYLRRNNHQLICPPRVIFTGAEGLLAIQRQRFHDWFNAPSAPSYGLSEGSASCFTCPNGHYHIDMEFGIFESQHIHDTENGYVGLIIGTGLHNFAQPFIRYSTNDLGTFSLKKCSCGLNSPILTYIDGRVESYIITPDGRQIGKLDSVFKDILTVHEVQLVQKTKNNIIVKIVPCTGYNNQTEYEIINGLKTYLGNEISFSIEKVTNIPKTKSGKLRFIISEITPHLLKELEE